MLFSKYAFKVLTLFLLSMHIATLQAQPVDNKAVEQNKLIPLAPPGPYFSSATPKETATSEPIQMPATAPEPVTGNPIKNAIKNSGNDFQQTEIDQSDDTRTVDQKHVTEQTGGNYDIELTNPLSEWPESAENNPQWAPAPPGPYGFVPDYIPRSTVTPSEQYRYRNPYNTGNNPYVVPYGQSAPGMMRPPMGRGYSNPGYQNQGYQNQGYQNPGYENQGYQNQGYQNQGYYYGRPNSGGYPGDYYKENYNRGGFDPRFKRNTLDQNDMNQTKPR